jgi:drug/metabolite transporter (DMT)-like permease
MNWILVAFLEPVLHAWANILDSNLINRVFKNAWSLTVFIAAADLLFLPIIWLLDKPHLISWQLVPYVILIAFIELVYAYPYYKALEDDDTSVAISLFSLGKIFVPVLAFIFVNERLNLSQYFGFLLIVVCSAALTFNPKANFRFNKSFFYMLLASSMLAVETVTYKHVFNNVSWGTGFFWTMTISGLLGLASFAWPKLRTGFKSEWPTLKSYYHYVLLVGIIGFFGNIGFSYAISQVSPTISSTVSSTQPIFVLLYAAIFSRYFPLAFKEKTNLKTTVKKIALFVFIGIGVFLTVR